jgi:hydrogenase expression/formation protein
MDLEGFAKRGLRRRDRSIKSKLIDLIREVKEIPSDRAAILAEAVLLRLKRPSIPGGRFSS